MGFSVYVYLYYPRTASAFEIHPDNPEQRILIATQSSNFKNEFVNILCDSLKKSPIHIKGIDVSDLSSMDDKDWDKIIIVNSYIINLNKTVKRFVDHAENPDKLLVFVTSGGADWQPNHDLKVDAITSASRKENITDIITLSLDWLGKENSTIWQPGNYLTALRFVTRLDVKKACQSINLARESYKTKYPNLRNVLNRTGYQYLRLNDVTSALLIFKLNIELFPEYWNVYDSYGEALYISGNIEDSIKNYQKALAINPESKSAKNMLKKLKNI